MIVTERKQNLIQVPQYGQSGVVFKPAIIAGVAHRKLRDRVLLHGKPIMDVNPEITDEEIECDLRTRRNEKSIRVRLGVIEINRVTQANVQSQGVNLADRPDGVEGHLWMDDHILLRKTVLSVIDVVVVLDP